MPASIALEEIQRLEDLQVDVGVEVGRRNMSLRAILEIEQGSVVKLLRPAGENMDVLVGGAFVAHGEIVVMEEIVGIRITDFGEED